MLTEVEIEASDGISARVKELLPQLSALRSISCYQDEESLDKELLFAGDEAETFCGELGKQCRHLREVAFDFMTDHCLETIALQWPHLRSVDFSNSEVSDAGVVALVEARGGQLTEVSLESTDVTDASLEAIAAHCAALEHLNVNHCEAITGAEGLSCVIGSCGRLQRLRAIKADASLFDYELQLVLEQLTRCTEELLELELDGDYRDADGALAEMLGKFPGLRLLDIKSDELIPDTVLRLVAAKCRCLETLRVEDKFLDGRVNIKDAGVWRRLLEGNSGLRELVLEVENVASYAQCETIVECGRRLEFIEMGTNENMSKESIK